MMYMLDINTIIYAIRHPEWDICKKIKKHLGKDLYISSITYGELEYGIQKSSDPVKNRIATVQFLIGMRILDFDEKAAIHFGEIFADLEKKGQRIGDRDMLIAAHARSISAVLVTNNTREFSRVQNLMIEDWK